MSGYPFKYITDTSLHDKIYLAYTEAALKSLNTDRAYQVKVINMENENIEEVVAVFVNGAKIYGPDQ